jgi:predicted PurR-regulated permease PerM
VVGEKMDFRKLLSELNKRGVSATVISIILLVVGLVIVVLFVIFVGQQGKTNILDLIVSLNQVKHGGT